MDGDDKFLTFKEFDAGMQSVGITQERFESLGGLLFEWRSKAAQSGH